MCGLHLLLQLVEVAATCYACVLLSIDVSSDTPYTLYDLAAYAASCLTGCTYIPQSALSNDSVSLTCKCVIRLPCSITDAADDLKAGPAGIQR